MTGDRSPRTKNIDALVERSEHWEVPARCDWCHLGRPRTVFFVNDDGLVSSVFTCRGCTDRVLEEQRLRALDVR